MEMIIGALIMLLIFMLIFLIRYFVLERKKDFILHNKYNDEMKDFNIKMSLYFKRIKREKRAKMKAHMRLQCKEKKFRKLCTSRCV